ncbi:Lectin-domain containing receptor kinase A4.3 [Hordeum vulgare]|nr:Lectin-domain containing receptor kinase A4.3 [Hordeum vulgare]
MVLQRLQVVPPRLRLARILKRPKARMAEAGRSRCRPMTKLACSRPSCKIKSASTWTVSLDLVFPDDYGLEEEDEVDIDGEPLIEDEFATQAVGVKPKRKRRRTKAYTAAEDKLLCDCWRDIGQDPKVGTNQKASTFWIHVHREFHECKKFAPYQMQSAHGWMSISE